MRKLDIHTTAKSGWQTLIKEAAKKNQISLSEQLECYLVFLLAGFTNNSGFSQQVIALDFLNSLHYFGRKKVYNLQNLGDRCLLYAGLFPEQARKRRVRISYYVDIGKTAYLEISQTANSKNHLNIDADLYLNLHHKFVEIIDLLHSVRELDKKQISLDLLQAEEFWADTKSMRAKKQLNDQINNKNSRYNLYIPVSYSTRNH